MFCEKCGREIPEDSVFCAYCGVRVPQETREEDWEEAARKREAKLPSSVGVTGKYRSPRRTSTRHSTPGCVVPGAPKKKCAVCGRELPASTVGDYCALCEMRRSRQQEAQERKAAEERYQREVAEGKRDRYDVSDEFDWGALQKPSSTPRASKTDGWNADAPEPKKNRKKRGWLAAVIVVVVALWLLPNVLGILYGAVEYFTDGRSGSIGIAIPEPLPDLPDSPMEAEAESALTESDEYEEWIEPMLDWTLNNYMPYSSEHLTYREFDRESVYWWTDGVINYVSGLGSAVNGDGDETVFSYSTAFVMLGDVPGESGYVLQIEIDGETLFDDMETVDSEGRITEEGGGAYDQDVGEFPFDEMPKYLTGKDGAI